MLMLFRSAETRSGLLSMVLLLLSVLPLVSDVPRIIVAFGVISVRYSIWCRFTRQGKQGILRRIGEKGWFLLLLLVKESYRQLPHQIQNSFKVAAAPAHASTWFDLHNSFRLRSRLKSQANSRMDSDSIFSQNPSHKKDTSSAKSCS